MYKETRSVLLNKSTSGGLNLSSIVNHGGCHSEEESEGHDGVFSKEDMTHLHVHPGVGSIMMGAALAAPFSEGPHWDNLQDSDALASSLPAVEQEYKDLLQKYQTLVGEINDIQEHNKSLRHNRNLGWEEDYKGERQTGHWETPEYFTSTNLRTLDTYNEYNTNSTKDTHNNLIMPTTNNFVSKFGGRCIENIEYAISMLWPGNWRPATQTPGQTTRSLPPKPELKQKVPAIKHNQHNRDDKHWMQINIGSPILPQIVPKIRKEALQSVENQYPVFSAITRFWYRLKKSFTGRVLGGLLQFVYDQFYQFYWLLKHTMNSIQYPFLPYDDDEDVSSEEVLSSLHNNEDRANHITPNIDTIATNKNSINENIKSLKYKIRVEPPTPPQCLSLNPCKTPFRNDEMKYNEMKMSDRHINTPSLLRTDSDPNLQLPYYYHKTSPIPPLSCVSPMNDIKEQSDQQV